MTDVLRRDGVLMSDQAVTSMEAAQIAVGVGFVSTLYRLTLGYDARGRDAGPASVIVKLPADNHYGVQAEALGAYVRELTYYRRIAWRSPLSAPHAYLADGAYGPEDGREFVLVIADLGGMELGDHLAGLSFDRATAVIDALARSHAWSLTADEVAQSSTVFPAINDPATSALYRYGLPTGWEIYRREARDPIPAIMHDLIAAYPDAVGRLTHSLAQPATLVHGDLRVDNLFFDSAGRPSVVDYQFAMRASGMYDVAYLVAQGLQTDVRNGRDRELVGRYATSFAAESGKEYDLDIAWRQYREAAVLSLAFPLIAISGWDGLGARARELCLVVMERAIATITDTGAAGLLTH